MRGQTRSRRGQQVCVSKAVVFSGLVKSPTEGKSATQSCSNPAVSPRTRDLFSGF